MSQPLRILFVEDILANQELAERQLRAERLEFVSLRIETRNAFLKALDDFQPGLIISAYAMPEFDGMQALKLTQQLHSDIPFIVFTDLVNVDTAVECIKAGACDYVIKEHAQRLPFAAREALRLHATLYDVTALKQAEEALSNRNRELLILNTTAVDLARAQSLEESGEFIVHKLKEISGAIAVTFGLYDPVQKNIRVKHAEFDPGVMNKLVRSLGWKQLSMITFPVDDSVHRDFIDHPIQYRKSFSEVTFGVIPELVSGIVQTLLGVDRFLGITFVLEGELYGAALVALRAKTSNPSYELIESFAQMTAVSLKRCQAEEALRENEENLKESQEIGKIGSWIYDLSGRIQWSEQMYRLYGVPASTNIPDAESFVALVHPDDRPAMLAWINAIAAEERPGEIEYRVVLPDEAIRTLSGIGRLIYDAANKPVRIAGTAQDITKRKQQEAEILKNNREISLLYEASQQLSQSLDLQSIYLSFCSLISSNMACDTLYIAGFDCQTELIRAKFAFMSGTPVDVSEFPPIPLEPVGSGIQSPVIRSGKSRMVNDYAEALKKTQTNYYIDEDGVVLEPEAEPVPGKFTQSGLFVPILLNNRVTGVVQIQSNEKSAYSLENLRIADALVSQIAVAENNAQLYEQSLNEIKARRQAEASLIQAYDATIAGWSQAMELRDKEIGGHALRVADLTLQIARALGVSEDMLVHIRRGAMLHDIGKLGVPDKILHKAGALTDEELVIMNKHPEFAYEMLSPIEYLRPAVDIPYCHHEKWDGSGYPRGLKGQDIPLDARIFALVDVYDALTSDRPYRAAWSHERALAFIRDQSGKQFDPHITPMFIELLEKL